MKRWSASGRKSGAAEADLPELVPPDDPERLAYEAGLRAIGVTPARVWNFPVRKPIRRPDWRDWVPIVSAGEPWYSWMRAHHQGLAQGK
jgi:hypothetical protein